jgi:hypothetical protein
VNTVAVSELPTAPPPDSAPRIAGRSLLEVGGLVTLAALAVAAIAGVIAVFERDSSAAGFGIGLGIGVLIFLFGATVACALACLIRGRVEYPALGALVAACLSLDLIVLAIWLDIDNEAYGKTAGIVAIWSLFGLVLLGLTLAVANPQRLALAMYVGAVSASAVGALLSTVLVLRSGDEATPETAPVIGTLPVGDDGMLQVVGAMLVLLAAFWFGALAASRLQDQTLKRTFTTSPSSTT